MLFIFIVMGLAYLFDFINGFHDAGNAIATIVTTGVLTPRQAVLWAAFFSFIAFLFFHLMVAKTIGYDLIEAKAMDTSLIFAALVGAVSWNLLTWYYGLPSSSSHALIGGLAGAAIVRGGFSTLKLSGFLKVAVGICISPVLGLCFGLLFTLGVMRCLQRRSEHRFSRAFKGLQLTSSALLSITHAANDAQKTMGMIAILLYSNGWLEGDFYIPLWVVLSCQVMISLGTLAGGWRIVKTMGSGITRLTPLRGCTAETSAALIIFVATDFGIPVSTTQTVTGAIAGVGMVNDIQGSNWSMIRRILWSWILTLPASGLVAGGVMALFSIRLGVS